ncbi:MAG: hypothetical protein J5582_06740 [Ruminococcus sp.]|uniref:hypothetical protein n=1 Tax=Ruminococcus sp. TaxID=41978 RepID=UPI0025F0137E|nr:hypothetical protein [Ruminococcus sp.]MBO4866257.1 hypothetical protein [Ruminococcus sp.]
MDKIKKIIKIKYVIIVLLLLFGYCCFFHIRMHMLEDYPEKYIKENYPNAVIQSTNEVLNDKRYEMHDYRPWYAIFPAQHRWEYSESDKWFAHTVFGRIRGDVIDVYSCYDPKAGISFTESFTVCGFIPRVKVENEEYNLKLFSDYEKGSALDEKLKESYDGKFFTVIKNGLIVVTKDISREDMMKLRGILDEEVAKQDDDDRTEYFIVDVSLLMYNKMNAYDWSDMDLMSDRTHQGFMALWDIAHLSEITIFKNGSSDFKYDPDIFESDKKKAFREQLLEKRSDKSLGLVIEYCSSDDVVHYYLADQACPADIWTGGCDDI